MKLSPRIIGARHFDATPVTAMDPGYDSWEASLTLSGINVQPGAYVCVACRGRDQYIVDGKRHSRTRTMICGIYLNGKMPTAEEWRNMPIIGTIGVDAGMAGFFQNKPDYDEKDWFDLCDRFNKKACLITPEGFFTESGYGDGVYNVHGLKNDQGLYTALEIRF